MPREGLHLGAPGIAYGMPWSLGVLGQDKSQSEVSIAGVKAGWGIKQGVPSHGMDGLLMVRGERGGVQGSC